MEPESINPYFFYLNVMVKVLHVPHCVTIVQLSSCVLQILGDCWALDQISEQLLTSQFGKQSSLEN